MDDTKAKLREIKAALGQLAEVQHKQAVTTAELIRWCIQTIQKDESIADRHWESWQEARLRRAKVRKERAQAWATLEGLAEALEADGAQIRINPAAMAAKITEGE